MQQLLLCREARLNLIRLEVFMVLSIGKYRQVGYAL